LPLPIARTNVELRDLLGSSRPGFVPTMGALHQGHVALIRRAALENEQTVVSVFVNPFQFGDTADLERYPRNLKSDVASAATAGATLIYAPAVEAIYPPGFDTWVEVGKLAQRWEGVARPGHFRGVATVVSILLNLVQPARTYFGEKDYQQLQVIRRMHADLALPGSIVACQTVRDADGLALSSRNVRLSPAERTSAQAIPRAIAAVLQAAARGERDAGRLESIGLSVLDVPGVRVDYLAIVDSESSQPISRLDRRARLLLAVEIGEVRLIDNAEILPPDGQDIVSGG
jgi:pantoate--beta-alanine ligase